MKTSLLASAFLVGVGWACVFKAKTPSQVNTGLGLMTLAAFVFWFAERR